MNKVNSIEYLTGFLMGLFLGIFFESGIIAIYHLFCVWFGWLRWNLNWWMLIPAPLVFGLFMGKAIASLHLEDY